MGIHMRSTDVAGFSYVIFPVNTYTVPIATNALREVEAGFDHVLYSVNHQQSRGIITQARFFCQLVGELPKPRLVVFLGAPDFKSRRSIFLCHANETVTILGRLYSVRKDEALQRPTWFYRPAHQTYYVADHFGDRTTCFSEEIMARVVLNAIHQPEEVKLAA